MFGRSADLHASRIPSLLHQKPGLPSCLCSTTEPRGRQYSPHRLRARLFRTKHAASYPRAWISLWLRGSRKIDMCRRNGVSFYILGFRGACGVPTTARPNSGRGSGGNRTCSQGGGISGDNGDTGCKYRGFGRGESRTNAKRDRPLAEGDISYEHPMGCESEIAEKIKATAAEARIKRWSGARGWRRRRCSVRQSMMLVLARRPASRERERESARGCAYVEDSVCVCYCGIYHLMLDYVLCHSILSACTYMPLSACAIAPEEYRTCSCK